MFFPRCTHPGQGSTGRTETSIAQHLGTTAAPGTPPGAPPAPSVHGAQRRARGQQMSTTRTTGRRRRTLAGLATASLLVAGLTACTGGEDPAAEEPAEGSDTPAGEAWEGVDLSLIHISEPTRL